MNNWKEYNLYICTYNFYLYSLYAHIVKEQYISIATIYNINNLKINE